MRLKISPDEQIRTTSIRVVDKEIKEKLLSYVYSYKHFENMVLILIQQNYGLFKEGKTENDFPYLSSYQVMRAVIRGTDGGKNKAKADYIKEKYKENQLMQKIIELGRTLKIHNLSMILNTVKSNFKSFFTKIKKGDKDARPPRPKKLAKVTHFAIPLDINAWSFLTKDQMGINLSNQMFYVFLGHENLIKVVGRLKNIQAVTIQMSNGEIYLKISYRHQFSPKPRKAIESSEVKELRDSLKQWKEEIKENPEIAQEPGVAELICKTEDSLERALARAKEAEQNIPEAKEAGIDIGVNNLAAIFVNDTKTQSLIIAGNIFKHYNAKFNRFIASLASSIAQLRNCLKERAETETEQRLQELQKFRSFLYEKRNRFFQDQFHKISKRILEYLHKHNVTDLYISKNLAELKNNGNCRLKKPAKQNFIQIPFIKLLDYILYQALEYGIRVHVVDESYTSKTSSISSDVVQIQQNAKQNKPVLTNDFKGSRVKRGLFKDTSIFKILNADINAAVNIVKVGTRKAFDWLKGFLFKLCNPIKIKCDWEFVRFLRANTNVG
jgi:IS605 OrfB family transposase